MNFITTGDTEMEIDMHFDSAFVRLIGNHKNRIYRKMGISELWNDLQLAQIKTHVRPLNVVWRSVKSWKRKKNKSLYICVCIASNEWVPQDAQSSFQYINIRKSEKNTHEKSKMRALSLDLSLSRFVFLILNLFSISFSLAHSPQLKKRLFFARNAIARAAVWFCML